MNIENFQANIKSFSIHLKDYVDVIDDDSCIEEYYSIKIYSLSPNHQYIAFIIYRCEVKATCSTTREYFIVIHNVLIQKDVYIGEWLDCESENIFCEFTEDSQYFLSEAKYSYILINIEMKKAQLFNKKKRGTLQFFNANNLYFHKAELIIYSFKNNSELAIPFDPHFKIIQSFKKNIIYYDLAKNSFYIFDLKSFKISLLWKIQTIFDIDYKINKQFLVEQKGNLTTLRFINNKKIIRNLRYAYLPHQYVEQNESIYIIRAVFNRVQDKKQKPSTFIIRIFDIIKGTIKVQNSMVKRRIKNFYDVKITESMYLELINEEKLIYVYK